MRSEHSEKVNSVDLRPADFSLAVARDLKASMTAFMSTEGLIFSISYKNW